MLTRVRRYFSRPIPELEPHAAYRLWAETYPPYAHNLLMELEQHALLALLPDVKNQRVLDLACGSGRYTQILQARGAHVTGLDFSYEMLARAEDSFYRVQGDLKALPLVNSYARCIVCGLAVGHLDDLPSALHEMARVLAPQGILVYSDFHAAGAGLGWKRTFRANEQTYAVKHIPRAEQEHRRALHAAGFKVEIMESVSVTADIANVNPRAAQFRAQWGDTPIALAVRAIKV